MTPVAKTYSVALSGFDGATVEVETDLKAGLPLFQIVGMGNKAISEARQRVRSAIINAGFSFPARKCTVNLAPAELPKDGTHFDLAIAISILVASGQLQKTEVDNCFFAGELGLDGVIRSIRGAVVIAEAAESAGARLFISRQNAPQARLVPGCNVIEVSSLAEAFQILKEVRNPQEDAQQLTIPPTEPDVTLDDISGNTQAKRALAIAAAGRHNLLLSGVPGVGKSLLAKALVGLLPPLEHRNILAVTKLQSLAHGAQAEVLTQPPLRTPHHTAPLTSIIGGGRRLLPGEISLAHRGVLLLDELPEFPRAHLEALRQPLETREVTLSHPGQSTTYPANFLLVGTMNPCPCGYLGSPTVACRCTAAQLAHYQKKLSGPLLDRIALRVTITTPNHEQLFSPSSLKKGQQSTVVKSIRQAVEAQRKRFRRRDYYNAYASQNQINTSFAVTRQAQELLKAAAERLSLSNRAALNILRVARTIADLEGSTGVTAAHVAEALQFR